MQFLKGVWRFLIGVKDALVLIFMLLLFGGLWAVMSVEAPAITVPQGSALHINMDGVLVDQATEIAPVAYVTGEPIIPETETAMLVRAIDKAADDPAISMITLDLDGFLGGGLANLESVGAALARFRAKNKEVQAWATAYADDGYYLASHASSIGISPMGAVLIAGPGGTSLYFKDALDKLQVNIEIFRVGTYKSFVEPFTRNESSPEAKAADQMLANDMWANWRAGVEKQRPELNIARLVEGWPQRLAGANQNQAELAKSAGLIDLVQSEAQWRAALQKKLGDGSEKGMPGDFKRIDLKDYWAARRPAGQTGPGVAVIHVAGTIVDGEAPQGEAGGDTISALIDHAVANDDVKALVIRVDSGGGSALASEQIRQAMQQARAKKLPVVASFGPVAASGGYWIGAGADTIFASPSTVTGSIGVFGIIPTFERTLKSFGVSSDGVATTPYSGQPNIVGGLNEPTSALIQSSVEDIYGQFLTLVSTSRKMPVLEVEKVAEGRVWSGARAKQLKLIDQYGDLQAAVREAGKRAGIEGEPRILKFTPRQPLLVQILNKLYGDTSANIPTDALARAVTASRMQAVAQIQAAAAVAKGPSVQAHCLSCTRFSVPQAAAADEGKLVQALKTRFGF